MSEIATEEEVTMNLAELAEMAGFAAQVFVRLYNSGQIQGVRRIGKSKFRVKKEMLLSGLAERAERLYSGSNHDE